VSAAVGAKPTLREWLAEGPFALAMSSGFFGFFAHAGVLTTLEDAGLLPTRVAGSSAGALITAGWGAGVDAPVMRDELLELERHHFWDPFPGFGLLRGKLFRQKLEALLPVSGFHEGRVPAAVSVWDAFSWKTRVLEEGEVASAIHASCAVPFMFHPVWIDRRPYLDGGIADRPGLLGLEGEPRVLYHHLLSKSPWRSKKGAQSQLPSRPGLVTFAIDELVRLGPFQLDKGAKAFEQGRRAMKIALDRPVAEPPGGGGGGDGGLVRLEAPELGPPA
jgi:NTE family protein